MATCIGLVAIWLPLFVLANLPVAPAIATAAGALQSLAMIAFVIVHAALALGWRGAMTYVGLGYAVGFACEALSINTGLPFGWFVHHAPGPKPFGVPLHVPLGYAFLGWPAWTLACLLGRDHPANAGRGYAGGLSRWIVPVLGGLIFTGYDLGYDAIGSAIMGMWTYRHPGGFYGVPVSNFIGWFITGWLIFTLLGVIEPRHASRRAAATGHGVYWLLPCLVWAAMTLQYPLLLLTRPAGEVLIAGHRLATGEIYAASMIVAMLAMLPVAIAAAAQACLIGRRAGSDG